MALKKKRKQPRESPGYNLVVAHLPSEPSTSENCAIGFPDYLHADKSQCIYISPDAWVIKLRALSLNGSLDLRKNINQ